MKTNRQPSTTSTSTPFSAVQSPTAYGAQAWFNRLTPEQKIGQVFVIGFEGSELTPELLEMITQYHIGGVVLFARNIQSPSQAVRLTNSLQKAALDSGHPGLMIAIDQEGGRVARLTEERGFTEFPSAMAISAASGKTASGSPDPEPAHAVYAALAGELRAVGINTNFAPDLDVNNNPQNPVIGLRSFGSDPQRVAALGIAAIEGHEKNGIIAFGKHFPGHGDTGTDSHTALPVIPHDLTRLAQVEFVPFQAAMQAGVAGIMSAHITFPAIDPKPGLPATLSPVVMHALIREEMGYNGLLITDSLEMGALEEAGFPVPLAAATAFQAGADLVLFNRSHELHVQSYQRIRQWVEEGKISRSRLDEAVSRVLRAKQKFGLLQPEQINENSAADHVGSQSAHEVSRRVAAQSITVLRDRQHLIPLAKEDQYLVVELPASAGLGRQLGFETLTLSDEPQESEIQQVLEKAQSGKARAVLVATSDANRSSGQAALVQALLDAQVPVIAVATRNPYDILAYPNVDAFLVSYGANPPALEALAGILTGQTQPQGRLPVDIPDLFKIGDGL